MGSFKTLGKNAEERKNPSQETLNPCPSAAGWEETLNSGPSAGMGSLETLGKKEHRRKTIAKEP
jgi:hypothetical protein